MSKRKVFLIVQSILCILVALLLAAAAVSIYREGAALETEDPLYWIFTREAAAQRLIPILPPLVLGPVLTAAGLVLGIRGEKAEKPVKDTETLYRITGGSFQQYRKEEASK